MKYILVGTRTIIKVQIFKIILCYIWTVKDGGGEITRLWSHPSGALTGPYRVPISTSESSSISDSKSADVGKEENTTNKITEVYDVRVR